MADAISPTERDTNQFFMSPAIFLRTAGDLGLIIVRGDGAGGLIAEAPELVASFESCLEYPALEIRWTCGYATEMPDTPSVL